MRLAARTLLVLAIGCGRESPGSADAGAPDAGDAGFEPEEPTAPEEPAAPVFEPCPSGWRAVRDASDPEVVTCDPWPASGPAECGPDEAHFPGEPGCERIGSPCPEGDFAEDLPADVPVVWVRAGEAAGGDGSLERPFATIAAGLSAVPDRGILSLSKGLFDEAVVLRRPVTIWGACVAETVVASSDPAEKEGTFTMTARAGATLHNLTVGGERVGLAVRSNSVPAVLDAVVVSGARRAGVDVWSEGRLQARRLVVRDTRGEGATGAYGYGLEVSLGASVEVAETVLERNRDAAMLVRDPGTSVVGTDLAIMRTEPRAGDLFGFGILMDGGSRLDLRRAAVHANLFTGVAVVTPATTLVAEDLVVSSTDAQRDDGELGFGLVVAEGARAELRRTALEDNATVGLSVDGLDTSLVADDLVVRGTRPQPSDGGHGEGLRVSGQAVAQVRRCALVRSSFSALTVVDEGTTLVATDLRASDTASREDVEDPADLGGHGLVVAYGARVDLQRARLARNRTLALFVDVAGELVASDLSVIETLGDSRSGGWGVAAQVSRGAVASLLRARIEDSRVAGLQVAGADARVEVDDLLVARTLEEGCLEEPCPEQVGGRALAALEGGALEVRRFRVSDNALCGVQVAWGSMDLREGVVSGNPVGANVQADGFDLARLQDRVVYRDNGRTLDATELPVPRAF